MFGVVPLGLTLSTYASDSPYFTFHSVVTMGSLGPTASQAGLGWVTDSPEGSKSDSVHKELVPGGRLLFTGYTLAIRRDKARNKCS